MENWTYYLGKWANGQHKLKHWVNWTKRVERWPNYLGNLNKSIEKWGLVTRGN